MDDFRADFFEKLKYKSKSELIEMIDKYKSRLTDVVVAHKGLIQEKKAIEESFLALMDSQKQNKVYNSVTEEAKKEILVSDQAEESITPSTSTEHLEKQLASLMNSLATLSAEKSRLEASYLADKKQLRAEKEIVEKKYNELIVEFNSQSNELDESKSKLAVERKERDKEHSDHYIMIRELQSLIAVERSAKEQLESELENAKIDSAKYVSLIEEYETKLQRLTRELEAASNELRFSSSKKNETDYSVELLEQEIVRLKLEHEQVLAKEKEQVRKMEDKTKALSMSQEERVVNLEDRLSELSDTVGMYERLRQQDQAVIKKLNEKLNQIMSHETYVETLTEKDDLETKLFKFKKEILRFNEKSESQIDIKKIFTEVIEMDHSVCKEDYNKLKREYDQYRKQVPIVASSNMVSNKQVEQLQNQVKHLQERIRALSDNSDEVERECKREVEHWKKLLKTEKLRFRETLSSAETDFRGRLSLLEEQLQKQRERSLALLEEKEQEIHSLQNTFQLFLPGYRQTPDDNNEVLLNRLQVNPGRDGAPHILHYANELARRDVEIANLRKSKHLVESALRDLQKAAINDNEKHLQERQTLREEIARLERCKSREGANLEYLKNVVFSFLTSNDVTGKRHMLNAIAAVLRFSELELDRVTKHSSNKWWNRPV